MYLSYPSLPQPVLRCFEQVKHKPVAASVLRVVALAYRIGSYTAPTWSANLRRDQSQDLDSLNDKGMTEYMLSPLPLKNNKAFLPIRSFTCLEMRKLLPIPLSLSA